MLKLGTYMLFSLLLVGIFSACKKHIDVPNVILILSDDQGWGDVGYNGNQMINTPTLDSLSKTSVVFDRFYVSPVCAPTRASLLTGKYHLSTGVSWVTHRKDVMRESEITIAEVLKENGYATSYYGKWHNGAQYPHNANGQGFDNFFGFNGGHCNQYFDATLNWNDSKVKSEGYIANVLTDSLIDYIQHVDRPFFAVLAFNTPHTPYQLPNKYYKYYRDHNLDKKTASIYGMCENIDDNVQRVKDALRNEKINDNTVFIFMSDNGPNYVRYNGGFKGRKAQVDEGGVRVPFLLDYPNGNFKSRHVSREFATHLDVLPTILELCNIDNDEIKTHGESFTDLLRNKPRNREVRSFYSHHIMDENNQSSSVRTTDYLLTCYPGDTALFNVQQDPFQMNNIIIGNDKIADSLKQMMNVWMMNVVSDSLIPQNIEIGHNLQKLIDLPAHEATLSDRVSFGGGMGWANDWITNWSTPKDSIYWKVSVVNPCSCSVNLLFSCEESDLNRQFSLCVQDTQINFLISEVFIGESVSNPDRVMRGEVNQRTWGTLPLGTIDLSIGDTELCVKFEDDYTTGIKIKGLEVKIEPDTNELVAIVNSIKN